MYITGLLPVRFSNQHQPRLASFMQKYPIDFGKYQ